ncbi:MAG: metallophosphoesterase [Saprospiraceae bacterium]|nr:metallophosphoesterase [Saprospiraceae bacterium]
MQKLIFVTMLVFGSQLFSQGILHKEILGRPTDNSISIRLFFAENTEFYVEYGIKYDQLINKTQTLLASAGLPADIKIEGLNKNTLYYYRILHRLDGTNAWTMRQTNSFHTQKSEGEQFTFVIQADPHLDEQSDTAVYSRCIKNQLEDNPDFIIDLGDIIMTDKLKNSAGAITRDSIISRCKYLRSFYELAGHSIPYFMVLGNHEGEAGWTLNNTANNIAIINAQERKKYFMNPIPDHFYTGDDTNNNFVGLRENYYAWKWGDALFIVLDPYWYTSPKPDANTGWRWTLGKKQYDWLKATLEKDKSLYKFVFCHQLVGGDPNGRGGIEFANLYEWGGYNLNGTYGFTTNRPGWDKPIKDMLRDYKVSAFFHGHDHFFGKQEKDCLIYQECPQPSHQSFQNANQATDYGYLSGVILPNSGHLRINVQASEVKIEYVRAYSAINETATRKNKDVAATYFIKKNDCYDTLSTSSTILWNRDYYNELVYPNPSNTETRISIELLNSSKVTLDIYDKNGNYINNLIFGSTIQNGKYEVIWDGIDQRGNKCPVGNYFYKLTDEKGIIASGKIIRI